MSINQHHHFKSKTKNPTGRQGSLMKNEKLFSMGTSFDERSDDEPSSFELSVPVTVRRNNSSKNLNVENIPLVSKWLLPWKNLMNFRLNLWFHF